MEKRKLRIGRIAALILVIVVPIVLLIVLSGRSNEKTRETGSLETTTAAVLSSVTTITSSVTTTTKTTTIPRIESPQCAAAALYSADDKSFIYGDNIHKKIAPASLTKLITAAVALKYSNNDAVFTVGSEQALVQPYSSLCGITVGSKLKLEELVTGMLMSSGNDAAYAIAVSVARDLEPDVYMTDEAAVKSFCRLMNDFARELGMNDSNFVNPDGWDDDEQYTTVSDLVRIAEYALNQRDIKEIIGARKKKIVTTFGEEYNWTNSNLLLDTESDYYCKYAIGVKTGTTLNAGNNLIAAFKKDKKTYITIVAGALSDQERYELTLKLFSPIE